MYTREAPALDLFTDSVRIMGDATLCGVMEFDQRLDPILLESAVRACIMAHPILHSRLVRGNGPAFWEMWPVSLPPFEVTDCTEAYHPQIIGPVDPYQPVQCRVRLLRRSSGDVIVVNLAHAEADGYGLQIFMSQLLQEYDKPGSVLPAHGGIPERDTLWTSKLSGDEKPASAPMKVINPPCGLILSVSQNNAPRFTGNVSAPGCWREFVPGPGNQGAVSMMWSWQRTSSR